MKTIQLGIKSVAKDKYRRDLTLRTQKGELTLRPTAIAMSVDRGLGGQRGFLTASDSRFEAGEAARLRTELAERGLDHQDVVSSLRSALRARSAEDRRLATVQPRIDQLMLSLAKSPSTARTVVSQVHDGGRATDGVRYEPRSGGGGMLVVSHGAYSERMLPLRDDGHGGLTLDPNDHLTLARIMMK